ncbi:MAG: HlyD family secretion protein [uncultured bacterium]|nr:MAG: HlyD family secretion protein [uncultured bacterium]
MSFYRFGCKVNMPKINPKLIIFSLCMGANLVLSAVACAKPTKPQMPPAAVEVAKVQTSASVDQLTATGNLIAIPGIVVKPEIAGRITKIYFTSGSKVKSGEPLIEIYPDIIKAQLAQAQAELKAAQLFFNRMKQVHATHTISDADYDKAKSSLEASKGKVAQHQANLDQTIVRAPFDGRLGVSLVSLGQYINVGQNIVSLQSLDPIYVDFTIPEVDVSKIVVGQSLNIRSSSYPNEVFIGTVSAIDPLINKNTRSLTVRAAVANKEEKLLPGAFADVTLFIGAQKQIIKIPQTAIVHEQTENYVYKVVDGKAVKTVVTTGSQDAQDVVIESGLKIDDVIVTQGQMKIHKDGEPVIIAPPPKS